MATLRSMTLRVRDDDGGGGSGQLVLLGENDDYWPVLRRTLGSSKVTGPRVHDARIASLCLAHGVSELWSADRDFSRFNELRVVNPLRG